ncbi:MAG: pitrilysin family protein [Chloroflexota bacterium]
MESNTLENPQNNLLKTQLENGLQVILKESHVAPVASFWIYYRVGSRNELPGKTGISHWVEHMLFKGTDLFPRGEFDKAVSRAGGTSNGMTSEDWTTYFETFPSNRIELALKAESDRMANALFDPQETESERTVIISEREASENSYFYRLLEELQAAAFREHSYRQPVIGWKSDLKTMTRDDLYEHYKTFYTPNNAIAVAVGDFDQDQMLAQIKEYFGKLPIGPEVPTTRLQESEQNAERRVTLRGIDPTSYLMMAFHAPPASHKDFFTMMLIDAILGGAKGIGFFGGGGNNRSNRLYKALVETQLAVQSGCFYQPAIDTTLFTFYATLAPSVSHSQVEETIWQEIKKMQSDGVTASELEKAMKQTKAQFAFSSESVTAQAYWLGFSEVVADEAWLDSWAEQLSSVTTEDVQRVANSYFTPNKQTVGWYLPEEEE